MSSSPFAATFSCRPGCFFFLTADWFQSLGAALLERGGSSFQPSLVSILGCFRSPESPQSGYIGTFPLYVRSFPLYFGSFPLYVRSSCDRCALRGKRPLATGVLCVQHNTSLGTVSLPLAPTAEGAGTEKLLRTADLILGFADTWLSLVVLHWANFLTSLHHCVLCR